METNKTTSYLIPLSILVAGALIAGAIFIGDSSNTQTTANVGGADRAKDIEIKGVTGEDRIIGSPNAPLVIVEYSDTECPFCKVFHNTMKDIISEYEGEVSWVYRHFPIAQLHARAIKEAEALECAREFGGNQGFWNYLDQVFERTDSNDSLDPNELPIIAGDIGLDVSAFNTCLSSGKYNDFILESVKEAVESGARGTPYSVIISQDGTKTPINGAEPIDMVRAKIDGLLK